MKTVETLTRFDELTKEFLAKTTLLVQTNNKQFSFFRFTKTLVLRMRGYIIQEIRELGKTREGNGKHAICWNLNVEFSFNGVGCKT